MNALLQVFFTSLYVLPAPTSPTPCLDSQQKAKLSITLSLRYPSSEERANEWCWLYWLKTFPSLSSPPFLLMSNASSIDLHVDLKEIQSQMPQVAFFPLWEIKRFNSPCLSTLIIIISPFVCLRCRLPLPSNRLSLSYFPFLLPNYVFRLFHKLVFCLSHSDDARRAEERRAVMQIIISRTQWSWRTVWSSRFQKDNESLATAHLQSV